MIPLTRHSAVILDEQRTPLPVDPVSVTLAMDDEWSPYLQGRIVVHAADAFALDRRRVWVRLRQSFGPDLSIAALTDWWGGSLAEMTEKAHGSIREVTRAHTTAWNQFETLRPIAYLTALLPPGDAKVGYMSEPDAPVSNFTKIMRQPGGTYDAPPPQTIEALMRVRPAESDAGDLLIEYDIEGEDIALHDYRRTEATTWESPHTSVRALVTHVLGFVDGQLQAGPDAAIATGTTWLPGQTAWDMLHPVLEVVGYRLYADTTGTYRLEPEAVRPTTVVLDQDQNLIDLTYATAPPYDGAVVEYNGGPTPTYDIHAPAGAKRIMHETRYTTHPGPGAAAQLTARALSRGKSARAQATSIYGLRPSDRIELAPPDDKFAGTVTAITWQYPQSRMDVTVRDLTPIT